MEIIRVGRTETWDRAAGLGLCGSVFRVRVGQPTDFGKVLVKHQMCGQRSR